MNLYVHTRTMKIEFSTMDYRFRASLRHGYQRVFLEFLDFNPPQGRPVGGGGIHRTRWIEWKQAQHHI